MIHGNLSDLRTLLSLKASGPNSFLGAQVTDPRSRVYGGQFLGQGLMAASKVCQGSVRSFHCYYIRAGSTDTPLTYSVVAVKEDLATVQATQNDKLLFTMDVAFGDFSALSGSSDTPGASGAQQSFAMPSVPAPTDCISRAEGIRGLATNTDSTWAVTDSPFEYRFVENIWTNNFVTPGHNVWFRARDPAQTAQELPQTTHQAMVAYFSDDPIMDNALFPHGWHRSWTELQTASLDHAMWFHAPLDLNHWLLFAQDSPVAAGGRGITRGLMFDQDGTLVASACQEILMRTPPAAQP